MTVTAPERPTLDAEAGTPFVLRLDYPLTFAKGDDGEPLREFEALAVPYEVETDRRNWLLGTTKLRIAKGAATFRDSAKVFYGHDWQLDQMPIGRVVAVNDTDAGPVARGRLSETVKADEVYALMQPDADGIAVLDRVSIGFYVTAYAVEDADTDAPVLVVLGADVFELSVVPFPQFDGAAVNDVLHTRPRKETNMTAPTITPPEAPDADVLAAIAAIEGQLGALGAQVATLGTAPAGPSGLSVPFRSYGEYVKALASGDTDAQTFAAEFEALAYEGGVSGDTTVRDSWVGDIIRLVEKSRKVWNLFDTGVLPADGTKLEYGKIAENTIAVDVQDVEGEAIVMGNVKIDTDFADVLTFAGGSELSLQQVKRSNVAVLDLHWRALGIAYGKATETYMRTVRAAVAAQTVGSLAALAEFDGWIDFLVDAAMHLDDKGLAPEYLNMSPDVFKALVKLREGTDGPFLLSRDTGRINLLEQTGDVAGLRIVLTPGTGFVEVGNSFALKTFESGGAPARLGPQEEITTLTQAIGVYGFGAVAVQDAKALVRPGA